MLIREPKTKEDFRRYYHLRWKILRAPWNQPEGSERDAIEDRCFHIMAIDENRSNIAAVARLQSNSKYESQIRYMAVDQDYRHQGIGQKIMYALEQHAINSNHSHIVLDAREPAVPFYEKMGYELTNKSHLLFGEIQHYRMKKNLQQAQSLST